jgi:CHAD domain-containing protein
VIDAAATSANGAWSAAPVIRHRRRQLARAAKRIRRDAKPEDFHVARVAARRLRSALRVVEESHDEKARRRAVELRRVGRKLGRARDLDVVLATVTELAASQGLAESSDVAAFGQDVRASRARARRKVVRMLEGKRFRRLRRELGALVQRAGDSGSAVEALVNARAARLSDVELDPLTASNEELHRYRISTKRFRYTLELVASRSELAQRVLGEAKRVQARLGALHDAVVVEAMVEDFANDHRRYRGSTDLEKLAAAFRVAQQRYRAELAGMLSEFRRNLTRVVREPGPPSQSGLGVSSVRHVPSSSRAGAG